MGEIIARFYGTSDNPLDKMDMESPHIDESSFAQIEKDLFPIVKEEEHHHQETLHDAMMRSLFHSSQPRPLAMYIRDPDNFMTQLFQETILWSESTGNYLSEQFVLWEWNLTTENYAEFLGTIIRDVGEEAAAMIASSPPDLYPLLVCLIFDRGQIKVETIIQGLMSENEAFALLIQAREAFRDRFELPDTTGLNMRTIATENWSIPPSTLTEVPKDSAEFRRVANDFDGGSDSIVRIDRIENTVWLWQYLEQKSIIDGRVVHDESEKLLFHGCPYSAAEQILQQGFDHDRIGRNGSSYGRGFYFSTRRSLSDRYAIPDPTTRRKHILMCRVLIGRSCLGDSAIRTCPRNYDSTSNHSDIHVVYSNRHVLPEYLITYK